MTRTDAAAANGAGGYAYRALRRDGVVAAGTIDAASAAEAHSALSRGGLLPIELRLVAARRERRAPMSADELALGLRVLADLLDAGLAVRRALTAFAPLAPPAWRLALPHLDQSLKEGRSFAASLADAPVEIPPLVVGIAAAGEAGHGLASAIRHAAELTESAAAVRAALRAALAYPAVLACAGSGALALMVGVVLPRFASILADLGQSLPRSTRLVLQLAAAARGACLPFIVIAVTIAVAVHAWTATERGRRQCHALLLRLPIVSDVRHAAATARTAFSLAALLDSGVPLPRALVVGARASGDAAVEMRLLDARHRIVRGDSAANAFAATRALSPLAVQLARAGEQSGRFAGMLRHAAKLEQERSERLVRTAVRLLEPALILLFASIVALVAAALLQALYSVRPT